jgi:hypothetical protein
LNGIINISQYSYVLGGVCLIVFEIILKYLEKGSWREAFFSVLPPRKGAVVLGEGGQAAQDSDSDASDHQAPDSTTDTTVPPGVNHVEASHASKEEETQTLTYSTGASKKHEKNI